MRFTTGITLALLMSTTGCGGDDDDGGSANPLAPTGVMSSAPTDTTTAQSDGGLSDLNVDGMRSATVDKNTIDFSSVKWEWNDARSHLEPDSLPDARVQAGSNVWRRDSGTGLIRILSYTDLSGFAFETAGGRWDLSQRRVGLYVSEISGADVETIRAGGGTGGREDGPAPFQCWTANITGANHQGGTQQIGQELGIEIDVRCNRVATTDDDTVINAAAAASHFRVAIQQYPGYWVEGTATADWISTTPKRVEHVGGYSDYMELFVTFESRENTTYETRGGYLIWESSPPDGVTVPVLRKILIDQDRDYPPGDVDTPGEASPVTLFCLNPCPQPMQVVSGATVSLRAVLDSTLGKECEIGQEYGNQHSNSKCDWRLMRKVQTTDSTPTDLGEFLVGGDSSHFVWKAPTLASTKTVKIRVSYQEAPRGSYGGEKRSTSNELSFSVLENVRILGRWRLQPLRLESPYPRVDKDRENPG